MGIFEKNGPIEIRTPRLSVQNIDSGKPVDLRKDKKLYMSQIYLGTWYKKKFADISYELGVIKQTRESSIKKATVQCIYKDDPISLRVSLYDERQNFGKNARSYSGPGKLLKKMSVLR